MFGTEYVIDLLNSCVKSAEPTISQPTISKTVLGYVSSGDVNKSSPYSKYCYLLTQNKKKEL